MTTKTAWLEKDYYETLGVARQATQKQITHSYRKLAWKLHPDVNPGKDDGQFKALSEAYESLNDPATRKEYDQFRAMPPPEDRNEEPPEDRNEASSETARPKVGGISDLANGHFNKYYKPANRGEDLQADVRISHQDAKTGTTVEFDVMSNTPCVSCSGTGAAPGTSPIICNKCGGSGRIMDTRGFFSVPCMCPECKGKGARIEECCPTCGGKGVVPKDCHRRCKIPPRTENGERYFYKGIGGGGRNGGPPGDLWLVVYVDRRKLFSGKDDAGKS